VLVGLAARPGNDSVGGSRAAASASASTVAVTRAK
jgi:hypothetical protein